MNYKKIFLAFVVLLFLQACNKNPTSSSTYAPGAPYWSPVWHPNGQILGFNRMPIKTIIHDGRDSYGYFYYRDSIGFWLINKDGSNLRRMTTFPLEAPSWSPDGKYIAFFSGAQIYKMSFNGLTFDTAHIVPLSSNQGSNFYPAWSPAGDTIYYDSNVENTSRGYRIHKMASDGSGQTNIGNKEIDTLLSREASCISSNNIVHTRGVGKYLQIFTMDSGGYNVTQITYDTLDIDEPATSSANFSKEDPKYFNNKIFYQSNGVYSVNLDGSGRVKLCARSTQNFSISKEGLIAYVDFDFSAVNKIAGTVWLMDINGNNKKQLTFNNY